MIKKQYGVTLIELMVSMILGLGLVAGIGQLFVQSQKSFTLQRSVSDMTDDASYILEMIAKGFLLAGYSDSGDTNYGSSPNTVLNSSPELKFDSCITDKTNTTKCDFIKGNDSSIIYRYRYGERAADAADSLNNFVCTASIAGTANKDDMVSVYLYKKNDSNGVPVLYCRAGINSDVPNAQPLISEVEKVLFKYGVRIKAYSGSVPNPPNDTFYYTDAATVTAGNNWTDVFAVQVFIVLRSVDDNVVRKKPNTYIVDGTTYTATDKRLYKVFSKTILLRANDH